MWFPPRFIAPLGLTLLIATPALSAAPGANPDEKAVAFFEKKVRPILVNHCSTCHSADTKPSGGLRVDDRNGLLSGGNTGPAVVPGKPGESLLLRRVTQANEKRRMPREGKPLSREQIADLRKWIRDGAAWPAVALPSSLGKPRPQYERLKREHWAWQPLSDPKVPKVRNTSWPRSAIDQFLLARLEAQGLTPTADADRAALLRRVTFDLTGLPPTPAELDGFLRDNSADAFTRVVDRLLASAHFGERWGRHWLDVARYAESTGPSRNLPYPHAWRYRDYVIDAVNADVPFDRFLREQIAGDLLPAPSGPERDRLLAATGFLALGVKDVNQRFKVRFIMDNVDEQIDVVSRGVLALTVSCARCHDHKFDPIPTTDYYALAGIFTSTDNCAGLRNKMGGGGLDYYNPAMLVRLTATVPPPPAEQVRKMQEEVAKAKAEWDAIRGTPKGLARGTNGQPFQRRFRLKYERLRGELAALNDPAARGYAIHGVREAQKIGDTAIRIRGVAERLGPAVPRGFLSAFQVPGAPRVNPKQSGRRELAEWLASPKNPLTARVFVNRAWHHLFGQGIVATVDNFGVTGAAPSHPELLDHLASRFIRDGWSVKKLVRAVVLSRAYQLASDAPARQRAIDPGNRLVRRHSPRRLDAEELRDALLACAGRLDPRRPAGSATMTLRVVEMRDTGPEARKLHEHADRSTYRSVYLPLLRGLTPHTLEAFDPVEQTLVTGRRDATTVPGQALYLLNSPFVRRQSLALAEALLQPKDATDAARIEQAYRLTLARSPNRREVERAQTFLAEYAAEYRKQDVQQPQAARSAAWQAFVQALFASAEFRYLK
jgi:mono/diheme cytochrome c family protein